jgi:PIN like domain
VSTPTPPSGHSGRPTFFIDRDLGRHAFPEGLRQAGLSVVTLAEHYGIPRDQKVADHQWMLEAAQHSWPVLGCDSILNGSITAAENVERVMHNLAAIIVTCDTPGPFIYRVHPRHIERLPLE